MIPEISLREVQKHNNEQSLWIVIYNDVYDVTKYLNEHPGGEEALLEVAGKDGTTAFIDVGHSDDAREIMKKFKIGTLPDSEKYIVSCPCPPMPFDTIMESRIYESQWNTGYIAYLAESSNRKSSHRMVTKTPSVPKVEPRIQSIVVPRERRPRGRPCDEEEPEERYMYSEFCYSHKIRRPQMIDAGTICASEPIEIPPPESSNWWIKWALLGLAGAITVGFIIKKRMAV